MAERWAGVDVGASKGFERAILERTGLQGLPARMNQDARDAIGAALSARLYDHGATESSGQIVVPSVR